METHKKVAGLAFCIVECSSFIFLVFSAEPAAAREERGGAAFAVNTTTNLNEKRTHKNAAERVMLMRIHYYTLCGVCTSFFLGRMGVHVFMTLHYFFIMIILFFLCAALLPAVAQ
jgi:hypothetical protein